MEEAFCHNGSDSRRGAVTVGTEVTSEAGCEDEIEPPDGGWGYAVCFGVGLIFMLGFGSSSAFGILFNDFFEVQGDGASGLTLVIGVYNGSLSIAGFVSGLALKHYSLRRVGLVGAGLFVAGDICTVFVTSTYQLACTFGVIRGAGFGVMVPVGFTAFNCYFKKKRTAMMSANQTMSSLASITFPLLVTRMLEAYGFRATLLLLLAIDLNLVAAMLVMHPVEWHLDRIPNNKYANGDLKNTYKHNSEVKVFAISSRADKKTSSVISEEDQLVQCQVKNYSRQVLHRLWSKICEHIDLDLLKQPRFVSVLVGIGFAFVSDVTYLALEPMLLFHYGFTKTEVAYCVMLGATADLLARFLLAVYTYFYQVNSRILFYVGVCITIFMRIALVSGEEYWYVCAVTVLSGCVRCTVQVLFPLVLAAAAPAPARFPAALALHILFSGALMLLADPLIGLVYYLSGSYVLCFSAMSACCLICVILWTGEYFIYEKNT